MNILDIPTVKWHWTTITGPTVSFKHVFYSSKSTWCAVCWIRRINFVAHLKEKSYHASQRFAQNDAAMWTLSLQEVLFSGGILLHRCFFCALRILPSTGGVWTCTSHVFFFLSSKWRQFWGGCRILRVANLVLRQSKQSCQTVWEN